jgi:hypothetical protein
VHLGVYFEDKAIVSSKARAITIAPAMDPFTKSFGEFTQDLLYCFFPFV